MKYFRKFSRARVQRKRGVRKAGYKRKYTRPSRSFAKKVQSVINKNAEDKQAWICNNNTGANNLILFNSGIASSGDIMDIVPVIGNGNLDYQRVADEIRVKHMQIKGYLNLSINSTTDQTSKRVAVRLMVIQPKRFNNYDDIVSNAGTWMPTLLKKGGSQTAFTGYISDLYAPINTDEITKYYDRVFYLSQDLYVEKGGSTVSAISFQSVKDTIRFFNIKIKTRNKLLRYDAGQSAGNRPTNWSPILVLGYAHLDGSTPDSVTTQVGLQYDSQLIYQDI